MGNEFSRSFICNSTTEKSPEVSISQLFNSAWVPSLAQLLGTNQEEWKVTVFLWALVQSIQTPHDAQLVSSIVGDVLPKVLQSSNTDAKIQSAWLVEKLCKVSSDIAEHLFREGILQSLIELAKDRTLPEDFTLNVLHALTQAASCTLIRESNFAVALLSTLASDPNKAIRAQSLASLGLYLEAPANSAIAFSNKQLIHVIIDTLQSQDPKEAHSAIQCVFSLSSHPQFKDSALCSDNIILNVVQIILDSTRHPPNAVYYALKTLENFTVLDIATQQLHTILPNLIELTTSSECESKISISACKVIQGASLVDKQFFHNLLGQRGISRILTKCLNSYHENSSIWYSNILHTIRVTILQNYNVRTNENNLNKLEISKEILEELEAPFIDYSAQVFQLFSLAIQENLKQLQEDMLLMIAVAARNYEFASLVEIGRAHV